MAKFICVFLLPLVPLCVVVLLLKDRSLSDNVFVALGAKIGGAAATYSSFVLLALKIWSATADGQEFRVRVNHRSWTGKAASELKFEIRCDDDDPIEGEIIQDDGESTDVDFEVPSRWSGHKVQVSILPPPGATSAAFILRGQFHEVTAESGNPHDHETPRPPAGSSQEGPPPPPPLPSPDLPCPPDMLPVPARTLFLGGGDHRHEARLSSFCIDRTEVTVAAYQQCLRKGMCSKDAGKVDWALYKSKHEEDLDNAYCNHSPAQDIYPMNCVNWQESQDYCHALGSAYRLPTEDEWEYAAAGPESRLYPWGDEAPDARRLNACGGECTGFRMHAGNDGYPASAPIGTYPAGASYFGALDMAGNVWEWTASWYDSNEKERVDRGGGWRDDLPVSASVRHRSFDVPQLRSPRVGFRCIWVPDASAN